jgi:hypothetical protein
MEEATGHFGPANALDVTPKNASTLDDIANQIRAEKEGQQKQPIVEHVDPETGEVTEKASTDSSPPSLQDWFDDIAAAPTAEGVDHKYGQVSEQFLSDPTAMASLTLAKTQRKQALAKPKEQKTADVASGSRKLFQKPDNPEGAAA